MTTADRRPAEVVRAQRRLQLLVEANRAILGELSVEAVLHQIAAFARELVDARYATLGVVGSDGEIEEFVRVGVEGVVGQTGQLPAGEGRLVSRVQEPLAEHLEPSSEDPGPQPGRHGSTQSSLEVPIKVRDAVYGNLYLTERAGGGGFTPEDETNLGALAVTAGIAIENARLYEDTERRQHWAEAAAQVSSVLLDPVGGIDPVGLVADTVLRLTQADVVSVVVPADQAGMLRVRLARGQGAEDLKDLVYPKARSIAALALETGRGVRVASPEERQRFDIHLQRVMDVGAFMGLPLHGSVGSHGVLVAARLRGRPGFSASDFELGESFAAQAAIAMELAAARADQQRLLVLQDRERIARDLHDHVIQRLFAAGLTLEGIAGSLDRPVASRLGSVVDDLDVTIRQIRTLIFRLQAAPAGPSLRSALLEVAKEASGVLGFDPGVAFEGPVDTVAAPALVDDVVAVCREAMSNVVRHAHARHVVLHVLATPDRLTVVVRDDGVGFGGVDRRSGLRNLEERALHYGGGCTLTDGPDGGTELRWSVPLT